MPGLRATAVTSPASETQNILPACYASSGCPTLFVCSTHNGPPARILLLPTIRRDPPTAPSPGAPSIQIVQHLQAPPSQPPPTSAAATARDFPGFNFSAFQLARLDKIIERRALTEVYRAAMHRLEGHPRNTEGQQHAGNRYAALQIYAEWLRLEGNQDAD
jgi:hypothetical protein